MIKQIIKVKKKWEMAEEIASTKTGGENEHASVEELEKFQCGLNIDEGNERWS